MKQWNAMTKRSACESAAAEVCHDLAQLGPEVLVDFPMHRRTDGRVVWLNRRWFLAQGINVLDQNASDEIARQLLRDFCWTTLRADTHESASFYDFEEQRSFQTDRYGASSAVSHGGSGRCAVVGSLNVKGVGPTPLVSSTADWYHSHGCMWLEEAIREAIFGEVAAEEFPHGAIAAVAIIALEGRVTDRLGERVEDQRALLIRTNFIRPAHFERAVGFGTAGFPESDAFKDTQRTRLSISRLREHFNGRPIGGVRIRNLKDLFTRLGEQVGFGWAHRLFHGAYVSSNLTIDGQLCDFGSFRALPSWRAAYTVDGAFPFGKDVHAFGPLLRSLRYYFRRFGGGDDALLLSEIDTDFIVRVAQRKFRSEVADFFEIHVPLATHSQEEIRALLEHYFEMQQRQLVDYFRGDQRLRARWVYSAMEGASLENREEQKLVEELKRVIGFSEGPPSELALARWRRARRYLRPRRLLYRENLLKLCQSFLLGKTTSDGSFMCHLSELIRTVSSRSRRHWADLPLNISAISHVFDGAAVAVHGIDLTTRQFVTWLSGPVVNGEWFLFGKRIPINGLDGEGFKLHRDGRQLSAAIASSEQSAYRQSNVVVAPGIEIALDKPDVIFDRVRTSCDGR